MTTEDKIDVLHNLVGVCIRTKIGWWKKKKNRKVVFGTKVYKFSDILLNLIQRYRWISHQKVRHSSGLPEGMALRFAISSVEKEMFNLLYSECLKCIGKEKSLKIVNKKINHIAGNMQYED